MPANLKTLATVQPRSGAYGTQVAAEPGKLYVLFYCLGGKLVVDIEGIAALPFTCSDTEVVPYGNEIEITQTGPIKVTITPDDGRIVWTMSIAE
ncbi:hypothetical protein GCM10010170_060440 [Dactylosporangium salmoneum]|uniref:Uncharacterized protein n=1 Tax=Dactylosporangium salmoneum TaxID=53361 RepID=A0ABP5TWG3_9ACTN